MPRASRARREGAATVLALGVALGLASRGAAALADPVPTDIVVVKRAGVPAYQEVTEGFAEACRVRARVIQLDDGTPLRFRPTDVVIAVGQQALDEVRGTPARVIAALALQVPPGTLAVGEPPPPDRALLALRTARPSVRRVGVVYGPGTEALFQQMAEPARASGLTLVPMPAPDGPAAARALFRRARAREIDAVWLAPDARVLTPQVFRYGLLIQARDRLPLVAVTRQQVRAGALLAVDTEPRAAGRRAAALANDLLRGAPAAALADDARAERPELVVSAQAARRLGVDLAALRDARVE